MTRRVLVAGIGNVFCSDDGFGVEVANRLATWSFPDGVRVAEFGIRGVHLAYELVDGYDALVLVDAMPMGDAAGTIAVLEPDAAGHLGGDAVMDAHSMNPQVVLATLERLGGNLSRVLIVGCQPATLEEGMGLSPPVADAVEPAARLCVELVNELLQPVEKGTRP